MKTINLFPHTLHVSWADPALILGGGGGTQVTNGLCYIYRVYPNTRAPPNIRAPPFLEPRNNDCARYFTYYRPR